MSEIPRLRMFAGPNGSGKSTLKRELREQLAPLYGVYLNPDDLEQSLVSEMQIDFARYGLNVTQNAVLSAFQDSPFLRAHGLSEVMNGLRFEANVLDFSPVGIPINSYIASTAIAFIRGQLLSARHSFTFETVMSHPSKVDFLKLAQESGFRTYLYFVATDDPAINCSRVKNRVARGGHDVPQEKIVSRYHRALELLYDAIGNTNRAYIFDNSGDGTKQTWLAEITEGKTLELKSNSVPVWFNKYVLEKAK